MPIALYARVSTVRQSQTQTTDQQLDRLRVYAEQRGWSLAADLVFRDPALIACVTPPRVRDWTAF